MTPDFDALVEAGLAAERECFIRPETDAARIRAILNAVLPLALGGARENLGDIIQRIESWEAAVRQVIGGREIQHGMDLSAARSELTRINALIGEG